MDRGQGSIVRQQGEDMAKVGKREVEIVRPEYQPSKAELEADMRVSASFDDAIEALCRPVSNRYIDRPRKK